MTVELLEPIAPGHGENESPAATGGGSNVYTDAEWDAVQRERFAIRQSFDAPTQWGEEVEF